MSHPDLDQMFYDQVKGICPFCRRPVNVDDLTSDESEATFIRTGMCQECFDLHYGG